MAWRRRSPLEISGINNYYTMITHIIAIGTLYCKSCTEVTVRALACWRLFSYNWQLIPGNFAFHGFSRLGKVTNLVSKLKLPESDSCAKAGSCENTIGGRLRRQSIDDVMVLATVCKGFNNEPVRMRGRTWTTHQTARGRYYACRVPKLRGKGISRRVRPGKRSESQLVKSLPRCAGSRQSESLERLAKSSNYSAGWSQWLLVRLALDHQGSYYLIKQCTLDFNECAFIAHRWNNVSRFLAQVQTS